MKKKKVLFVVHQLNYGGVQKSLISALNALDYDENEVTLYIRKNRINLIDDVNCNVKKIIVNDDKTHYYRKPYVIWLMLCETVYNLLKRKKKSADIHQKLVDYINEAQMKYEKKHHFNDDIVYDIAVSYIQGYTAKFVADYINAKKKVMLFHSSNDEKHNLHQNILKKFHRIVGVNETVGNVLKSSYTEETEKIRALDNYVDPESVRARAAESILDRDDNKLYFCTCGRLAKEKGYDLAVAAAKILKAKNVQFHWWFVGDGAERKSLEEKIANEGFENNIEITGMQHNPYTFMQACDIYVQPSYEESYGLTIAEAKILCKPIVSTATIGGELQIEHKESGILTGISAEQIADGILTFVENRDLKYHVENNLKNIDYDRTMENYKKQWKETLEV